MDNAVSDKPKYYPFLDGLRALAVLWVISHHVIIFFDLRETLGSFFPLVFSFTYMGDLGVDMFFVISGFLITGLLLPDLKSQIRVKRFYTRRFFKIIPQYWFALFFGITFTLFVSPYVIKGFFTIYSHNSYASILSYFFFFQNYSYHMPIMAHTWSLAIEEHFYLIYPLILFVICKVQKDEDGRRNLLIAVLLILIILGHLFRYFCIRSEILMNFANHGHIYWQTTLYRADALIFGCLLKVLEEQISQRGKGVSRTGSGIFFFMGCSIYGIFIITGFDYSHWLHYTLAYCAPGLFIISALKGFPLIVHICEHSGLRWIGKNSYAIYLWHYILVLQFSRLSPKYGTIGIIIAYVISSILMGALTTNTVERYFLNMRKRIMP